MATIQEFPAAGSGPAIEEFPVIEEFPADGAAAVGTPAIAPPQLDLDKLEREEAMRRAISAGMESGTDLTHALFQQLPADIGSGLHTVGRGIFEGGVNALANTIQQFQPDTDTGAAGAEDTEQAIRSLPGVQRAFVRGAQGLVETAPQMALTAVDPVVGVASFGFTPEGFDPKSAVIAAALPFIGSKAGLITEVIASKAGVTSDAARVALNKLGGAAGAAGLIGADQALAIAKLPEHERGEAWIDAVGNVGSMFLLGTMGHTKRPAGNIEPIRLKNPFAVKIQPKADPTYQPPVNDQRAKEQAEARAKADADKLAERKAYVARGGDRLTGKDLDTTREMFDTPEGRETRTDKAGQGSLFAQGEPQIRTDETRIPNRGITPEQAHAAITEFLGTNELPSGIRVTSDPTVGWAARIEGRNKITVNAAQISTPERARRVILEEGLHGVWFEPKVQRAWQKFRDGVSAADLERVFTERKRQGLPTDAATIREEAAIDNLLNADANKGLAARVWQAIRQAFKDLFGIELPTSARGELVSAAKEFLQGRASGILPEGQTAFSPASETRGSTFAAGEYLPDEAEALAGKSPEELRTARDTAEADLKRWQRAVVAPEERGGLSKAEVTQRRNLATAEFRSASEALLNHPDYVAEQVLKQHAAIKEANELLKPAGVTIAPEDFPNPARVQEQLTPEAFARYRTLANDIEASSIELGKMKPKLVSRIMDEMRADGRLPKLKSLDENAGRSLEAVTDWLRANGIDSPRLTLADRFNLAAKAREAVGQVKGNLLKARQQAGAMWRAAVESYKAPPKDTDFRHVIKSWIYADQRTGLATHQFVKELMQQVPKLVRRKAMSVWLEANGDESLLRFQADAVPAEYREIYQVAQKLTPGEKRLALKLKQDFAYKLDDALNVGLLEKGRMDYGVPQRWKVKPEAGGSDATGGPNKKGGAGNPLAKLDPKSPFFAFQRETPSYFEGIMAKGVPESLDVAHLVTVYDAAFHKALSSRAMIAALQEAKAADGLPVTKISGNASMGSADGSRAYFVDSKAWNKSDVAADGRPYRSLDHSALKGWKLAFKDAEGNPIIVRGDMLIHPDHFEYLKNELGRSALREAPIMGAVLKSQAFLKASKLSASFFHLATIGEHMASHLVNPFLNGFKLDLRDPKQQLLVRHGLELGMSYPQMAYEEGLMSAHKGLFNMVPGLGDLSAKITDWMFRDYIPAIMMKAGLKAFEANSRRYGKELTEGQIAELTANQMNAAGGLLNYRLRGAEGNFWGQLGANKTLMDVQRLFLLAPQFLEARARVVGQALKPYGMEQRKMLIMQAAILYAGARVLNYLLNDDPHWHDNPLSVVYQGRAYSIRTIVGDFWHMLTDPKSFAAGRLSPLSRIGIESVTGRDLRTGARKEPPYQTENPFSRTAQNIVVDVAKWMLPITVEGALPSAKGTEQSLGSAALSTIGIGSRKFTATMQMRDMAREFNRASRDPQTREWQRRRDSGAFADGPYRKLDALLDAGDVAGAKKELAGLLRDGKRLEQIEQRYERNVYFTGSAARETEFVRGLNPRERTTYDAAKAEQRARAQAFGRIARP